MDKLTYETALEYADDTIPKSMFDNFDDWFDAIKDEFPPALTDSIEFQQMARNSWNEEMKEDEEIPEREEIQRPVFEKPAIEQEKVFAFGKKKELTQAQFERKITKSETTPIIIEQRSTAQPEPVIRQPIVIQTPELQTQRVLPQTGRAPVITTQRFFTTGQKIKGAFRRLLRR